MAGHLGTPPNLGETQSADDQIWVLASRSSQNWIQNETNGTPSGRIIFKYFICQIKLPHPIEMPLGSLVGMFLENKKQGILTWEVFLCMGLSWLKKFVIGVFWGDFFCIWCFFRGYFLWGLHGARNRDPREIQRSSFYSLWDHYRIFIGNDHIQISDLVFSYMTRLPYLTQIISRTISAVNHHSE